MAFLELGNKPHHDKVHIPHARIISAQSLKCEGRSITGTTLIHADPALMFARFRTKAPKDCGFATTSQVSGTGALQSATRAFHLSKRRNQDMLKHYFIKEHR